MELREKENIGNEIPPIQMKQLTNYLLVCFVFSPSIFLGQKFKLQTGIGASQIAWYENQPTLDFSAKITFQRPQSSKLFFLQLNTLGNVTNSLVDKKSYTFIVPENYSKEIEGDLYSAYRGGMAELGIQFNQKSNKTKAHISPSFSLYSKSIARKISANKTEYVEEEKISLHGITTGLALEIPGKTPISLEGQLFQPLLGNITLFGRYVGVPYETKSVKNDLSYRVKMNVKYHKFGFCLTYELLNLGGAQNNKSKSIEPSKASFVSTHFSYNF